MGMYFELGNEVNAAHFMINLKEAELWPPSTAFRNSAIQTVLGKASKYQNCPAEWRCGCRMFGYWVEDSVKDVEEQLKGLCLTCIKNGKVSKADGNCQAATHSLCKGQTQAD